MAEVSERTLRAWIATIMLCEDCDDLTPMSVDDAECTLREWRKEIDDVPKSLTAEKLAEIWNWLLDDAEIDAEV